MRMGKRQRREIYFVTKDGTYYVFGYMGRVEDGRVMIYRPQVFDPDIGSVEEVKAGLRKLVKDKASYRGDHDFCLDVSPWYFLQMLLVGSVTRENLENSVLIQRKAVLVVDAVHGAFVEKTGALVGLQLYVSPGLLDVWQDYMLRLR